MRSWLIVTSLLLAVSASAADEPSVKFGAQIFADYTRSDEASAFNVTRAYINVTGNLNKYVSFRVTPDVARETGDGSSLAGSQELRLKFAFAQLDLDRWLTKGSWVRGGLIPLPWAEYEETYYRYRFQGPIMVDREGYITTADYGVAMRYALPNDLGDVVGGVFNGEGFAHAETNDRKAAMLRVSINPVKRFHVAAFYDNDAYAAGEPRDRAVGEVAFDHPRVTAAVDVLSARDRTTRSRGYSVWATPKIARGWEALLRRDSIEPDTGSGGRKTRDIEGIAYWLPLQGGPAAAIMLDRDATRGAGGRLTTYGVKVMVSF
jgi:hypothetical protein